MGRTVFVQIVVYYFYSAVTCFMVVLEMLKSEALRAKQLMGFNLLKAWWVIGLLIGLLIGEAGVGAELQPCE